MDEEQYSDDGLSAFNEDRTTSTGKRKRLEVSKGKQTRTRVSKACNRCRSKKDKCDGARPTCSACTALGQSCSYDPSTKKRGLPEGYVRGIEKLWALAMDKIEALEGTMTTLMESAYAEWSDERVGDALHEKWKESQVSRQLERLLSSLDEENNGARQREENHNLGSHPQTASHRTSDHEPMKSAVGFATGSWEYQIVRNSNVTVGSNLGANGVTLDTSTPSASGSLLGIAEFGTVKDARNRGISSTTVKPLEDSSSQWPTPKRVKFRTTSNLELPLTTPQLLDLYFSHTHCWFPIVERHHILRVSYRYSQGSHAVNPKSTSGDHAVLWAILSYANVQHRAIASNTDRANDPSHTVRGRPSVNQDSSQSSSMTSQAMYSIARDLIPTEREKFDLGHVQALLLLTLFNVGAGEWTSAWILVGHAVRVAVELGLASETFSQNKIDTNGRKKNVFLGCFVLDTLVSARLERCPHLRREDVERVGAIEEDGLEEWDPWIDSTAAQGPSTGGRRRGPTFALSCFNRLVGILAFLNDITRDVSKGPDREAFCHKLSDKMQGWRDALPLPYQLLGSERLPDHSTSSLLPHQSYLYLAYITTLAALHFHSYPFRHAFQNPERRPPEIFSKIPFQVAAILKQHSDNFGTLIVPPTMEYSLMLAIEASTISGTQGPFNDSVAQIYQFTSELQSVWSGFTSLTGTLTGQGHGDQSFSTELGEYSRIAKASSVVGATAEFPPASATALLQQNSETWNSNVPTQESAAYITSTLVPTNVNHDRSQSNQNLFETPLRAFNPETFTPGTWGGHQAPSLMSDMSTLTDASPHQGQNLGTIDTFDVNMSGLDEYNRAIDAISIPNNLSMVDSNLANTPSFMGDDVDAIFRDLAHLDTTEWATNREQGLKEFGFADDTTFRAFCNDPERLVTSNAFPQTSPIADYWPPPGFYPGTFPDTQLEASQILRSLSGNEQYPTISEQTVR